MPLPTGKQLKRELGRLDTINLARAAEDVILSRLGEIEEGRKARSGILKRARPKDWSPAKRAEGQRRANDLKGKYVKVFLDTFPRRGVGLGWNADIHEGLARDPEIFKALMEEHPDLAQEAKSLGRKHRINLFQAIAEDRTRILDLSPRRAAGTSGREEWLGV